MDFGSIADKLRDKVEDAQDQNARTAAIMEENEQEARIAFIEDTEDAIEDLKRFVHSDDFNDALEILALTEQFKASRGKSIAGIFIEKVNVELEKYGKKIEGLLADKNRKVGDGWDPEIVSINKEHIFPLQEERRRLQEIDQDLTLYLNNGGCILTFEGFRRRIGNDLLQPETVVKEFVLFGDPKRHPSKLLPLIEKKLKDRAELIEKL